MFIQISVFSIAQDELLNRVIASYNQVNFFAIHSKFVSAMATDTTSSFYSIYVHQPSQNTAIVVEPLGRKERYVFTPKNYFYFNDSLKQYEQKSRKKGERTGYYNDLKRLPFVNQKTLARVLAASSLYSETGEYFVLRNKNSRYYINKQSYLLDKVLEEIPTKYGTTYFEFLISSHQENVDLDAILSKQTAYKLIEKRAKDEKPKIIIGDKIPAFKFTSINNNTYTNATLSGRYIVLDLFYQGCPPCIKAFPGLNDLSASYDTSQLVVLGIDPMLNDTLRMKEFAERFQIKYDVVAGHPAREFWKEIKNSSYPYSFIIGPTGIVEYIMEGYTPASFWKFKKRLEHLLRQ